MDTSTADRRTLIVFPHAGGNSAAYRELTRRLAADFDVHCIELPGHGRLRHQPFIEEMHAIVDYAHAQSREIMADRPVVFLGHSMGAWIAYMVAERARERPPVHLFASAARPPHLGVHRKLLPLAPDDFVRELERLGGVPAELLANREALDLFLPALRADLGAIEPFQPPLARPLDVPMTVLRATGDEITASDAMAWQATTTGTFRMHTLPGSHFFLTEQADTVHAVLRRALRPV